MPTRSIPVASDQFYHIYNRGNNKQRIFRKTWDYEFFLRSMIARFSKAHVEIVAYCLMPTHFHSLVRPFKDIDFANVMRSLSGSYVKSFHLWYKTSGHLFEDDYQAKSVNDQEYLLRLIPYIHLNPVNAKIVRQPWDWEFSDCKSWCSEGEESFSKNELRSQLYGGSREYRDYLANYAKWKEKIQMLERFLFR